MLKKVIAFTTIWILTGIALTFGGDNRGKDRYLRPLHATGRDDELARKSVQSAPSRSQDTGPGTLLMETWVDNVTNSSMTRNIHNYGDGRLSVARMEQTTQTSADRRTFFAHFDGSNWLLPTTAMQSTRTGWGDIVAFSDGREVVIGHTDTPGGPDVAVDAVANFGLWIENFPGEWPPNTAADLTWARTAVDAAGTIHVVMSHFSYIPFDFLVDIGNRSSTQAPLPVYGRSTNEGISFDWRYAFQATGAAPEDPPDTTGGIWVGGSSADVYQMDTWNNKVGLACTGNYPLSEDQFFRNREMMFWESEDNGQTWITTNVTQFGDDFLPALEGLAFMTGQHMDFLYDNNGEPHIIWNTLLSTRDSTGTDPRQNTFADAPLMHWSPTTGITEIIRRSDIPELVVAGLDTSFGGIDPWAFPSGNGIFYPSMGVDAANTLYVVFNAPDTSVDEAGTPYLDIYATASADGGATWGTPPANVTASPGTEDKVPSLAKLVDDNLHIVYHSDEVNGGIVQPGNQTVVSSLLYYSFPAADVPTVPTTSVAEPRAGLPSSFSLAQNYPNPFNPTTQIDFQIPISGKVSLKVYNLVGQEVATLVDGRLNAGEHSYIWNAAKSLPSGVYVYKLESQGFSDSKKLVLMK